MQGPVVRGRVLADDSRVAQLPAVTGIEVGLRLARPAPTTDEPVPTSHSADPQVAVSSTKILATRFNTHCLKKNGFFIELQP